MIKALRNGGAHLDFRTREGMTALHKAVRCRNHAALLVSQGSCCGGLSLPAALRPSTGSSSHPIQAAGRVMPSLGQSISRVAVGEHSLVQKRGVHVSLVQKTGRALPAAVAGAFPDPLRGRFP